MFTTPNVHEIVSPFVPSPSTDQFFGEMRAYRARAAELRMLDNSRCDDHGDLRVYCGCRP
jgi:hypothetical protein